MSRELADAIRACFDESFLANPANAAWKSATGNGTRPVDVQVLLALQKPVAALAGHGAAANHLDVVAEAVQRYQNETGLQIVESFGRKQISLRKPPPASSSAAPGSDNSGNANSSSDAAAAAAAQSTGVSIGDDDADGNADSRTVFAAPIHYKATEAEISAFFSQYGKVASVERRKYLERGIPKLRPSVFVMFASKQDALNCVASRPSYGKCPSQLGSMFVPRLVVSMKGDPASRDALADEDTRIEHQQQQHPLQDGGGDSSNAPSHRRLIVRGCICVAREIPAEIPQKDIKSKLGSIRGVGNAIDTVFMPPTNDMLKLAYVYCTSPAAANTLLSCYSRVFSANEPYGASLGKAVPKLEKCRDAEEEVAMQIYQDAVAARTQKKIEKNAKRRQREDNEEME